MAEEGRAIAEEVRGAATAASAMAGKASKKPEERRTSDAWASLEDEASSDKFEREGQPAEPQAAKKAVAMNENQATSGAVTESTSGFGARSVGRAWS